MSESRLRQTLFSAATLGAIYFTAPWPGIQAIFHALLVLGLAPASQGILGAVLWACAAGWTVEGTLHLYPRLGGTPLADMALALLLWWLRTQWPPDSRTAFWARMGVFSVFQTLWVHTVVRLAAGPHAWGWIWLWPLISVPVWATLAFHLQRTPLRR